MQADAPLKFQLFGVRNNSNSEEPQPLVAPLTLINKPCQIQVVCHWFDHLHGPMRAAKILLRLKRGDDIVVEEDLFGTFQRGDDLVYIHHREFLDEPIV